MLLLQQKGHWQQGKEGQVLAMENEGRERIDDEMMVVVEKLRNITEHVSIFFWKLRKVRIVMEWEFP